MIYVRLLSIFILLTLIGCNNSDIEVITLPLDRATIPEGIVVDPHTKDIYVSSVHMDQLVRCDAKTNKTEIVFNRADHGYSIGVGMDLYDNHLYALGVYDRDTFSLLYIKNMDTDRVVSFKVDSLDKTYFNDLAIDDDGNCYITDRDNHNLYFYDNATRSIQLFWLDEQIEHPNGIAISKDQTKLFVDSYSHGIRIIDIQQKKILNTLHSPTAERGIDGIKYHKGQLYFIVNGIKDKSQHGLYSLDLIDNETDFGNMDPELVFHEKMKLPTTFSIVGNDFYVLANSQLDLLDQESNTIIDTSKLTETYVLRKSILRRN